jgi:hypothetical protein
MAMLRITRPGFPPCNRTRYGWPELLCALVNASLVGMFIAGAGGPHWVIL